MTYKNSNFSGLLYYNPVADGFNPVEEAYINPPGTINEGSSFQIGVTTWNIPDGTTLFYRLTNFVNLTAGRFPDLGDSFVITRNRGYILEAVTADHTDATGTQTFDIIVSKTLNGPGIATLTGIVVSDTSRSASYSVTPSSTSINEGDTVTFTVNTTGVADGTTLYHWGGGNINAERLSGIQGTVTINSGTATFTVTVSANQYTDGNGQAFQILLGLSNLGDQVASSDYVFVADTSQTPAGLPLNWYGTQTAVTPTGSWSTSGTGVALSSGAYVNVGQNLQGTTFTVTIDADLNTAGSPWVVLWGNDNYTAQTGYVMYFNSTTVIGLGTWTARFVSGVSPNITTAGRKVYTAVVNGTTLSIYINGVLINAGVQTGSVTTIPNNNFYIGARHGNSGTGVADAKGGIYYSAKVQGTALTANQVLAEYLTYPGNKTFTSTQPVGYNGSNSVWITTNATNDVWANAIPVGATLVATGVGTFTINGKYAPGTIGNPDWQLTVSPNTASFPVGTSLTFTWTV